MFRVRSQKYLKLAGIDVPKKYHSKTQSYNGSRYDSIKEAKYAAELDFRKKAGDIKEWKRQVRIPLVVNGYTVGNYYVDFEVEHNDGTHEFVEVKGFETAIWRLKWAIFEALYSQKPDVLLTVVK